MGWGGPGGITPYGLARRSLGSPVLWLFGVSASAPMTVLAGGTVATFAALLAFGHPCPVSDLFGVGGRELLHRLELPEPWAADTTAALQLINQLDVEITAGERALRRLGADHRYVPLLMTTPRCRVGTGLHHRRRNRRHRPLRQPDQVGRVHRAVSAGLPVRRQGPPRPVEQERTEVPALGADRGGYPRLPSSDLRRALPAHQDPAGPPTRTQDRQVDLARRLSEAIWHTLSTNRPFAPAGAA
jgi:transposase